MDGGEGLAEVGIGGGFPVEMGESLTRGGLFANCLTFLLQEIGFDGLLSLVSCLYFMPQEISQPTWLD